MPRFIVFRKANKPVHNSRNYSAAVMVLPSSIGPTTFMTFQIRRPLYKISTWLYRLILRLLILLAQWPNLFGFSIALTSNGVGYPIVPGIRPRGCLGNRLQVIGWALSIA